MKVLRSFPKFPFYFTTGSTPSSDILPTELPFILGIDERTGRLLQCPEATVSVALDRAYGAGSLITGYMDETGIGRQYADDFLQFLLEQIGPGSLERSRILEVGCGTGYFLSRLKALGADVLGMEPGPQGQAGKHKYGVEVLQGYFPPKESIGKFDLIVQYALLEHLEDPEKYLKSLREHLAENGKIVLAVPRCDEQITFGDISMFVHEHWSYFSNATLRSTLEASGYAVVTLRSAGFGGVWYAIGTAEQTPRVVRADFDENGTATFLSNLDRNRAKIAGLLRESLGADRSVGFYCPGRIINYLALIRSDVDLTRVPIRFFDDNEKIQDQYYPGFPYVIEDGGTLLSNPVGILLIASWTFGSQIKARLVENGYTGQVLTMRELIAEADVFTQIQ